MNILVSCKTSVYSFDHYSKQTYRDVSESLHLILSLSQTCLRQYSTHAQLKRQYVAPQTALGCTAKVY